MFSQISRSIPAPSIQSTGRPNEDPAGNHNSVGVHKKQALCTVQVYRITLILKCCTPLIHFEFSFFLIIEDK